MTTGPRTVEGDPEGFPFTFACRRSGNCCSRPGGAVRVTAEEVRAIAAFLDLDEGAFRSRFVRAGVDELVEGFGSRCVFLDDGPTSSCRIHPVRPRRCRSWPFWPELLESDERLAEARRLCPGVRMRARS